MDGELGYWSTLLEAQRPGYVSESIVGWLSRISPGVLTVPFIDPAIPSTCPTHAPAHIFVHSSATIGDKKAIVRNSGEQ